MSLPYEADLIKNAKELRKNATKQERHLWYGFLRTYPLRFQRQKTIGSYIVDFYCHKAKLVVELDGSQHYDEAAKLYDARRTAFLKSQGLTVLRLANIDIDRNFEGACMLIEKAILRQ